MLSLVYILGPSLVDPDLQFVQQPRSLPCRPNPQFGLHPCSLLCRPRSSVRSTALLPALSDPYPNFSLQPPSLHCRPRPSVWSTALLPALSTPSFRHVCGLVPLLFSLCFSSFCSFTLSLANLELLFNIWLHPLNLLHSFLITAVTRQRIVKYNLIQLLNINDGNRFPKSYLHKRCTSRWCWLVWTSFSNPYNRQSLDLFYTLKNLTYL